MIRSRCFDSFTLVGLFLCKLFLRTKKFVLHQFAVNRQIMINFSYKLFPRSYLLKLFLWINSILSIFRSFVLMHSRWLFIVIHVDLFIVKNFPQLCWLKHFHNFVVILYLQFCWMELVIEYFKGTFILRRFIRNYY